MSPSLAGEVDRLEEAAQTLGADLAKGLSPEEASRRLADGRNELPPPPVRSWFSRIWKQLRDPMSLLLLAAASLSLFALREPRDAAAIAAIVILNVTVAVIQEEKAVTALEALRSAAAPTARVLRAGVPVTLPAAEVVPGDMVLLAAGERVPADLWIVESWSLEADESLLTGESLPVAKGPANEVDPAVPVADRGWMLHSGTLVTAGSAHALVVATGVATAMGRLATHLAGPPTATPLQRRLARLSARLGQAALLIALAVFGLIVLRLGDDPGAVEQAFLAAVALAVAAVPEGLPTVVTLSLALGVRRMAREGAIVRNLPAVETLGSTTVLLTDKTGTLTQNRMSFELVVPAEGEPVHPGKLGPAIGQVVSLVTVLCNDATLDPPQGDPVDL
ncbi:MAG TPA: HAD-IC family P-type ATPase, partial [Acidimicrobiia bacterium]|nr:HAD-IC family P-type ATPase [Acidimicrobiia bacterium]